MDPAAAVSQESFSQSNDSAIDGYGQQGGHGDKGGNVTDIRNAFTSTQRELGRTRGELQEYQKRLAEVQQRANESGELVDRLKGVFAPQEQGEEDPTAEWQNQLDLYLKAAWDADKAGRPMPLTTNLAINFFQDKIKNYSEQKALRAQIEQLTKATQQLSDPSREVDHRAASHIDSRIIDYVERLYGTSEQTFPERAAQYQAIAGQVRNEIINLQKTQPHVWESVRRDEKKQQKLVEWVVEKNQPPKVRQILENERLKSTPLEDGELHAAFFETRQLPPGPMRDKTQAEIRQQILARMMERRTPRGRGRGISGLYGR